MHLGRRGGDRKGDFVPLSIAVDEDEIRIAVAIETGDRDAAPESLGQQLAPGGAVDMDEVDASFSRAIPEDEAARLRVRRLPLLHRRNDRRRIRRGRRRAATRPPHTEHDQAREHGDHRQRTPQRPANLGIAVRTRSQGLGSGRASAKGAPDAGEDADGVSRPNAPSRCRSWMTTASAAWFAAG